MDPEIPEHRINRGERFPLVYCSVCRKPYQRWISDTTKVRPHTKQGGGGECTGSRHLPLPKGTPALVHIIDPQQRLICCGKKASDVPAFDTFVPNAESAIGRCTCPEWTRRHPPSDSPG